MSKARASPVREITESLNITLEAADGTLGTVTGTLSRGDTVNRNRRYYPTTVLAAAAERARADVEAGRLIGLLDHPTWDEGNKGTPGKIAIKWTALEMDGDDLNGKGVIVGTSAGKELAALKAAEVAVGLSTNANVAGHYRPATDFDAAADPDDFVYAVEAMSLLTIDVVNDPSNLAAWIEKESLQVMAESTKREERRMTLEELLKEHPELAAQIREAAIKEATAESFKKSNPTLFAEIQALAPKPAAEAASPLEKQFVTLQAEVEQLRDKNLRQERAAIAGQMLAAADLRQLPKAGEIDLNARFAAQVEAAAMAAATADAARSAVAALIEERRALVGAAQPGLNNPGITRREHQPGNTSDHLAVTRARLGL